MKRLPFILLTLLLIATSLFGQERWGRDGSWGRNDIAWGRGAVNTPIQFISEWETENAGSATKTIVLPLTNDSDLNINVNWGDGSYSHITAGNWDTDNTHLYATTGTKTIKITGTLQGFQFDNAGDILKITEISQWGGFDVSTNCAFYACANLVVSATDFPLISTSDLINTFRGATSLTSIGDPTGWNITGVTSMQNLLRGTAFDQDLSSWDISLVTVMSNMLEGNTTLSTANYSAMLIAWEAGAHQDNVVAHFGDATYSFEAAAAHAALIDDGWTITDGGDEIPGLVAFFPMSQVQASGTTINDLSSTENDGTAANAPSFVTGRDAVANRSIQFDPGASDEIVITDNAAYNIATTLSVSVWFKNDDAGLVGVETLVSKWQAAVGKREWMVRVDADEKIRIFFSADGTTNDYWVSTNAITPNVSNLLIFTYNAGTVNVRLNGAALTGDWAAAGINSIRNDNVNVVIGNYDGATAFWDGAIQDALIYNRVITGGEIAIIEAGDF